MSIADTLKNGAPESGILALRLQELNQLFDPQDPSPFGEKDLNPYTEKYLIDSVKELHVKAPRKLMLHLSQPAPLCENDVADAVRAHFARQSDLLRRNLRQLLRRGWISLGVGLSFLAVVFVVGQAVVRLLEPSSLTTLLNESLLIGGWVAMWRPLEIFLYDWWPIVSERRIRIQLSKIKVKIVRTDNAQTGSQQNNE